MRREAESVAVVGVGAVGTYITHVLNEAGFEPLLIFPSFESAKRAREQGLSLNLPDGTSAKVKGFITTWEGVGNSSLRVAFLCTKAYDVPKAAVALRPKLMRESAVVSCQNGLGSLEAIRKIVPMAEVLALILNCGVMREWEGVFSLVGCSTSYMQISERFGYLSDLLMPMELRIVEDIEPFRWLKLAVNSAVNPITAVNMVRNGAILEDPYLWRLAELVVREVASVSSAWGVEMPADPIDELRKVCSATSRNMSSMLQDILSGHRTEVDFINGAVVGRGLVKGLEVGANRALWLLIRYMESSRASR
ncbi:MAG: 2-dehydropantoate 2-reductase [Desulfurococcales archaeon]|nr:2-dehydropantoate 2-reductase [Desulfurococcales archaeon]